MLAGGPGTAATVHSTVPSAAPYEQRPTWQAESQTSHTILAMLFDAMSMSIAPALLKQLRPSSAMKDEPVGLTTRSLLESSSCDHQQ